MAVELYIDVLILEDDWCINWLMWKCGIRVLTGDIALISTDDPPTWNSGHFTGWGFPLRASLRWNCRCLRTSLQHEHLNKYKCKSLWSCTVFKEFQKLVNKAKIPSAHNFLCPASDFEEQTFHSHSWGETGNLQGDGAQPGDIQGIVHLSQFGSRGKGRRGAGGREKGNGKETPFWKRGECGEAEEAKNRSVVGRPWQQQQSERGKQRCRVSRINVRQCDTSEKQKERG